MHYRSEQCRISKSTHHAHLALNLARGQTEKERQIFGGPILQTR